VPTTEISVKRRFRVGLVVLVGLTALGIGIFMVGSRANLFTRKFEYHIHFPSAAGLVPGNQVRLAGVMVGSVTDVLLSPQPGDSTVKVMVSVDKRVADRIRLDTRAEIKTIGLLGDKYVELEGGSAGVPRIEPGGEIPAAAGGGIEKLLAGSEDLLTNLTAISFSLKKILHRTEAGEGLLGQITTNTPESEAMGVNLNRTLGHLNSILTKVDKGEGFVGRLLADEKYGKETADSLQAAVFSLRRLLEKLESGQGAIAGLLSDPQEKEKVYRMIDSLSQAGVSLAAVTRDIQSGHGLLATLLHDEQFSHEFTLHLKSFSEHLDSISEKIDQGQGTAAQLVNDPKVYDAINDIVVGINDSKLLRWLIRNRQKAGIKERYEKEKGRAESSEK
jgi:phospholipid/cholesterol/gamma-HCH transport system substrate-binding protein